LDYLQKCEKNLDKYEIYPDFVELSLHLANVQSLGKENILLLTDKKFESCDDEIFIKDLYPKKPRELTIEETEELDKTDYFHSPPNLSQLITHVQKSTMVVTCGNSQGSGWVISLGEVIDTADPETKQIDKLYPGSVITNYHVIKDCVGNERAVTTSNGTTQYEAILFSTDKANDLAIVSTKLVLPALEISDEPAPGWWTMALGSPFGIEKSVSIGNVMNVLENQIISTAPINPGNSGGPLVNSFGQVIGTNTWKLKGADGFNVAMSVNLLCESLVACNELIWNN
jgi:hypothetical protein